MANNLLGNPWIIDTTTTFSLCTANYISMKTIRWIEATTAGHLCEIVDDDSNIIWRSVASGGTYVEAELMENVNHLGRVRGFRASILMSGKLLIYYQ
jgi:hypothetical protein